MTMLPTTCSGVWADFQRMMTVSQVCQRLSCSKAVVTKVSIVRYEDVGDV